MKFANNHIPGVFNLVKSLKDKLLLSIHKKTTRNKIATLGIKEHSIAQRGNNLEIVAIGERTKLWEIIKWSRRTPLFYQVEEIVFQFSDVTVSKEV